MVYLAGIHLSHNQGVESIVAASTVATMASFFAQQIRTHKQANSQGGKITALPTTFLGRAVTPIHAVAILAAPLTYLAGVFSNGMEQPQWYLNTGLDEFMPLEVGTKATIRTVAALGFVATIGIHELILRVLGKQLHYIGTREKGEVVSTGPYAVVRHPLYTLALSQLAIMSAVYWSWIPLVSLAICVPDIAYKITLEERLMEDDLAMGPAYVEYKKKVTYRLIPYIW